MSTMEEVAAVLQGAGWLPNWRDREDPAKLVYAQDCGASWNVGGIAPDGVMRWKNTGLAPDSPDTPDDPVAAARWLVARFAVAPAAEPEQTPAHEAHSETGSEEEKAGTAGHPVDSAIDDVSAVEPASAPSADDDVSNAGNADPLDADFSEPLPELGQELAEEHPEEYAASVAIFGDNLDQKRTAAIGLVMRHARSLMPFWTSDSDIALIELRNYAMGAAEGRWAQDEHRARELQEMEATLSRMNAIAAARDAKVEFLESATREEVEAFDPEANWP